MPPSAEPPSLGAALDRAAERRATIGSVPGDGALVLVVDDDAAPLADDRGSERPVLRWLDAGDPRLAAAEGEYAFLGSGEDGVDRWVFALRGGADGRTWEGLGSFAPMRVIGGDLDPREAEAFVTAVSLARWLLDSAHCPRCGARSPVTGGGWSRHCIACDREIFPRTDPAVIVAVTDPSRQRLLLGSHVAWGMGRFSCFAGFVEAGESLEATAQREVLEEAGVHVHDLHYSGSQPWPYPRSLMVGFTAVTETERAVADGQEIVEVRWFDRAEIGAALAGESDVRLPGSASIARALIEQWLRSVP